VWTTKVTAPNKGDAVQQENNPQSATFHGVPRSRTTAKERSACCN